MSTIKTIVSQHRPDLKPYEELYKQLHAHPELSTQETDTASTITERLKALSAPSGLLDIRTGIGGHGQIAILRNGAGPTILLRADIDALPVQEQTGLDYASTQRAVDSEDGLEKPVMHACGHDTHITALLAATETLLNARADWSGTLVSLFQPAEEKRAGAKGMVADGLYDEKRHACPIPDVLFGQHVAPFPAGMVATKTGVLMSTSDSFDVTIHGRGAHGSMPNMSIDPVLTACYIVTRLQGVVSREVPPNELAVLTVGSIRAGETHNVIPGEAVIRLNMRTQNEDVRRLMKEAIFRIVNAECSAAGCRQEPTIKEAGDFPLSFNEPEIVEKLDVEMKEYFGDSWSKTMQPVPASEDFKILASAVGRPSCFWFFGGTDPKLVDSLRKEGRLNELPVNHSPLFAPVIQPTLQTGVDALSVAALTYLKK
ncbi:hypothetical protein DV736_g631, partial [Chaetothyriales sp. CBS 134916]